MEHKPELERFLPPPAGPVTPTRDNEPTTEVRGRPQAPSGMGLSYRRRIQAGIAGALVLLVVGGATVAATNSLRERGAPAPERVDRNDPEIAPGAQPSAAAPAKKAGRRSRSPKSHGRARQRSRARRVRVRVPIAASQAHESEPAQQLTQPRTTRHRSPKREPKQRKPTRAKKKVPLPAPPGVPLFHCFSAKRKDHYMTADQASVGQMEESRADYDCTVVGYVYDTEVQGTKAIRLDDGSSVYIFSSIEARTEPTCTKHELYIHRGGADSWYNTTESDEGVAGYICT